MTQMLKLVHHKKRNVGLIFEFFSRFIAKAIFEEKDQEIQKAKALLSKHFHAGTDLHKEFLLFKSLFETKGLTNKETALRLMDQVKSSVKLQSQKKLDLEKTSLIHEINQVLNKDGQFFNQNIKNYKTYATIQTLLNEWRNEDLLSEGVKCFFGPVTQLEDQVLNYLTEQPEKAPPSIEEMKTAEIDSLVVDLMKDKLEQKYSVLLTEEQKEIVRLYTFVDSDDSKETLVSRMKTLAEDFRVISSSVLLNETIQLETKSKLLEVKRALDSQELAVLQEALTDDLVTFYLTLSSLNGELKALPRNGQI